ncbi:flagellar hook-associated protein FlgK [Yoonia sp.]|uniref:flagellar hook-associated protein FlgK n=1 Tax=Yoonia sp. TaxID=2212373 RepID=UPI0019FE17F5|nr:flagellar hook-associated protein FlgK [Yoonia sp.]MBE0412563.1 flagellar hook-associated protein FlgK [Yoonia sp.]
MSISSALNNALSGLSATARMAEVVSSNLSNALTDGYGRRSVELNASQVGKVGGGVRLETISRFVDAGLLSDRRQASATLGSEDRSAAILTRLEQTLGQPDDATSLGSRLAAFESALISASSDPASDLRLATVVDRLGNVAMTLRENTSTTQTLRQEADALIHQDVKKLNRALAQVADLNRDILRVGSIGNDPSALIDARQQVVDQIAEIVPVREMVRENGTIGLRTTNGVLLLESRPMQFGFTPTPTITADMTLMSGALSGITLDGQPLDPVNGVGRLSGGTLGAAFALRDQTLVDMQMGLDGIAADLIARFQDPGNDPTLTAGNPGLLTDLGGSLDFSDLVGLAGRIQVNTAIDPATGGTLRLVRDGMNNPTPGPVGDATQLNRWVTSLAMVRADVAGTPVRSAAGRIGAFAADLGSTRLLAEENLSFAAARWDFLREAELSQGVDTDVELQMLLRIEQAYAANAKVIQSAEFMMQRLMEIS